MAKTLKHACIGAPAIFMAVKWTGHEKEEKSLIVLANSFLTTVDSIAVLLLFR